MKTLARLLTLSLFVLILSACSGGESEEEAKTLYIGGIPDQNLSVLEERFGSLAEHLSSELGVEVEYVPVVDYSSLVTSFKNGEIMLAWFGGLTGAQAKSFTPGASSIAQRPLDQQFTSMFIVNAESSIDSLAELAGTSFTFGSTNSTSGHLMPRSFLLEAGVDPETDFQGVPNFSGSHDLTWKLVESGSFEAGALNAAVWNRAVSDGDVDLSKVRVLEETPEYVDYQWVAHPDLETDWDEGLTADLQNALLGISQDTSLEQRILELFETDSFVAVNESDYDELEQIARSLNMLQ